MGQIELVLVWALAAAFAHAADPPGGYYHSKYDYVDIEDVLNHKRLVQHYGSCLLNRGPCPPEGADLKRILPEALETNCLRCTEKQKVVVRTTINRIKEEYPNVWKELVDAYDPTGVYIDRFEASFADKTSVEDQANLIANRFSEDASANNLVQVASPSPSVFPYSGISPETTTTTSTTTVKTFTSQTGATSTTARPVTRPPTRPPTTTTTTTTTTRKPSTTTTTTTRPQSNPYPENSLPSSFLTLWPLQTSTKPPSYGWRPTGSTTQNIFFRPFQTIRPIDVIKVDTGVQLLGSISDIGNKVLQAGSQVAGMVLSTVQALVGH